MKTRTEKACYWFTTNRTMHAHVWEKGNQFYIWCLCWGLLLTAFRPAGYPGEALSISGRGTINLLRGLATLITEASVDEQGAVTKAEMNTFLANGSVAASNYHSRRKVLQSSTKPCSCIPAKSSLSSLSLEKVMKPLITSAMILIVPLVFFYKDAFGMK